MFRANRIRDLPIIILILLLPALCFAQTELDVGMSTSSGVVDQQQGIMDMAWFEGDTRLSGQWRYTETEGERIEEKGLVRAEYDKNIDEDWVIWVYEQAGYDHARGIQAENFAGSGPKFTFLDTKETILSLSVGVLHHYTEYDGGTSEALCRFSIRPKFRGEWNKYRVEAWMFWQPVLDYAHDYILHGRASLRYAITDKVGAKISVEDEYRSVSLREKNNLMTALAVSWEF